MKGDLIVTFTGTFVIPKAERPDDRGSIAHWLLNFMEDTIKDSENTDEAFDRMKLRLTIKEAKS